MAAVRTARSVWKGSVTQGGGKVSAVTSGVFTDLDVTLPTRSGEEAQGNTSPEELIAAAHASCYSMALSAGLTRSGTPPDSLDVSASVTFDMVDGAPTVTTSVLSVTGSVPGITAGQFAEAAETAKNGCPISRALASVAISLESVTLA